MTAACYKSRDDESDNNKDKVLLASKKMMLVGHVLDHVLNHIIIGLVTTALHIVPPKQAFKYFLFSDNSFILLKNRVLIGGLLTVLRRPCCLKLFLCDIRYYCWCQILLCFHPPALFLWCFALAITCRIHCISFISLLIRVYKLTCLLDIKFGIVGRTWPVASGFVWSWYTCYLTHFYCPVHSF